MNEDVAGLVERLEKLVVLDEVGPDNPLARAASTIRALDAKLREAVEVIRHYKAKWCAPEYGSAHCGEFDEHSCGGCKAHAFLAKLEKQEDSTSE